MATTSERTHVAALDDERRRGRDVGEGDDGGKEEDEKEGLHGGGRLGGAVCALARDDGNGRVPSAHPVALLSERVADLHFACVVTIVDRSTIGRWPRARSVDLTRGGGFVSAHVSLPRPRLRAL